MSMKTMGMTNAKSIGARVKRHEDPRFLTGRGTYLDDVVLPGMVHIAFVRSTHAHARIVSIDTAAAQQVEGVLAVITGAQSEKHDVIMDAPSTFGYPTPVLPLDVARYVGEPLAAVAAASRYEAEDGADAVRVAYEPKPAVVDLERALRPDSVQLHEGKSNVFQHLDFKTEGFEAAFAGAGHRLSDRFVIQRHTANSLETRGCIASYDPGSRSLTVYLSHQSPHLARQLIADILKWPEHRVRVIVPDVGGGFGMKAAFYAEDMACVLMSMHLGRPVKWISDRREALLSDVHARENIHDVEVAFEDDGHIVAVRDHLMNSAGAYPAFPFSGATGETALAARMLLGPYKIPHIAFTTDCVLTNKTPLGAYRGVWGPVASYVQEGIVDRVARALGMDPAEVRRVNMLTDQDFPYATPTGLVYDPGSYGASMEEALRLVGYDEFRARQKALRAQGRYIGVGISVFVEPSAFAGSEAGEVPYDSCYVQVEPSGQVIASVGLGPSGQGHETMISQVLADQIGVDPSDVVVLHGDTSSAPFGGGTGGSRSAMTGGGAAIRAGQTVAAKMRKIAAHLLEAGEADIELSSGKAFVKGVPSRGVTVKEIAQVAYLDISRLPEDVEPGLEALGRYKPVAEMTFSNGCHIAEVEVDPGTGHVQVVNYVVANDCGVVINPTIVEGQIHGGVAQGIGSTFLEHLAYDEDGQLLTTSWMDYLMPTSTEVPRMAISHLETPSASLGGFKGMAEGSLIGAPAALACAVSDALEPFGAMVAELPVTPESVLRLIREGKSRVS